jgi:glycine/D-amino acid oxidase-like deaminating enzyme
MRIAIIGAGFAGLATAWHLLQFKGTRVDLFDSKGIGEGASGVSAGLLHPYAGLHCRLNPEAREGCQEALELFAVAEKAAGQRVAMQTGMLRLAVTDEAKIDYRNCFELHGDVSWWEAEECQAKVPGVIGHPGLFIHSAWTVNSLAYLNGLWKACENLGAQFHHRSIIVLSELASYDHVVIAAGAGIKEFPEMEKLPVAYLKGQVLELEWPSKMPPLPFPVNAQAYVLMMPGNRSCLLGATFERQFSEEGPDAAKARHELFPKLEPFLPFLLQSKVLDCRSGVRISAPAHMPLLHRFGSKYWVYTGLGSKGLLYHALYAKKLSSKILTGDPNVSHKQPQ